MTRIIKWDGNGPFPTIDKLEPGEAIEFDMTPEAAARLKASGVRLTWTNEDGTRGEMLFDPPPARSHLLWPVPFALLIFVFMCNIGLMFYALAEPGERRALLIVTLAFCVALPYIPTRRRP